MNWRNRVLEGDVLARLADLPDESVHCVVTSPPYWGLRDYGVDGQLGLEPTIEEYLERMTAVFREARRVLRRDGTCWVNMGDTYFTGAGAGRRPSSGKHGEDLPVPDVQPNRFPQRGLKPKDLCGIPWRLALALQEDGWWLRADIIWAKPNSMPSSVTDRPGVAHEYVFLLTKSAKYFYDAEAVREPPKSLKVQHPTAIAFGRDGLECDRPNQRNKVHRPNRTPRPSFPPARTPSRTRRPIWRCASFAKARGGTRRRPICILWCGIPAGSWPGPPETTCASRRPTGLTPGREHGG